MSRAVELAEAAVGAEPDEGLVAVAALRTLVEVLEEAHVRRARELGWSWQDVADALGVTRQTVHKKYVSSRRMRSQ